LLVLQINQNNGSTAKKYNSFVSTFKVSPAIAKSIERMPKKSHRKLDMNFKNSCNRRKKSISSKDRSKGQISIASHCKNKVSYHKLTRNPSKTEGLDSAYGTLMETYSEILSRKNKNTKKYSKKEMSQSFHVGQKRIHKHKNSYLESYINTVNRYAGKENNNKNDKHLNPTSEGYKKTIASRLYYRRNTADCGRKKSERRQMKKKKMSVEDQNFNFNPSGNFRT